jgi:predicted alpha/beta hydrolase family esterase
MNTLPLSFPEKSTTVRIRPLPGPAAVRAVFRLAARVAPGWSAAAACRLFFSPPRPSRRAEQTEWLDRGRRFELETPGGSLVGWVWGAGEPVLLLHGWGGHAGQLTPYVEPLVEAGYQPVALDLPAHGEALGSQTSVRHLAEAILRAGERFGPFAGLVAHSFGGAATTLALDAGLVARRLVFVAPPARFETFTERFIAGLGFDEAAASRFRRRAEDWVGLRFDEIEARRLARHQDAPLLVVHDRHDDEVLFEEGSELARCWPGARLIATEGLGHYRILRDREVVAATVGFLAESLDIAPARLAAAG